MARTNEAIGRALAEVWERLKGDMPLENSASVQQKVHLVFRPVSDTTRVWVDAVDHVMPVRNQETLLRSFRIRLTPPESVPKWEWIVNESAHGEGVTYTPTFLDYDQKRDDAEEQGVGLRPELDSLRDPTLAEVERARRVLEECWRLYLSGDKAAIYYWPWEG